MLGIEYGKAFTFTVVMLKDELYHTVRTDQYQATQATIYAQLIPLLLMQAYHPLQQIVIMYT